VPEVQSRRRRARAVPLPAVRHRKCIRRGFGLVRWELLSDAPVWQQLEARGATIATVAFQRSRWSRWPYRSDRAQSTRRQRAGRRRAHSEWDFRLEHVRSINVSGDKFGLVYPGIGWLIFRERADLAEDLVFYENYLGKRDATFTLNFSTGSAMIVAQYYNFVRLGWDGHSYIMHTMQATRESSPRTT
jgi:glutamate/tyrosine decarboxylase-like PLP-dependent enzyme